MTRELFLKTLKTIKHYRELTNKFCDVLEEMSPNESCNCFLYSEYENLCYDFFAEIYGNDDAEFIFYWTIDQDFGNYGPLELKFPLSGIEVSIKSDEELYDFIEDFHRNSKDEVNVKKELEALKIVKEKNVNVARIKNSQIDLIYYNCKERKENQLTQEEYNLLREVFCK